MLISNDGKVLTAAHVVQTADAALVEFPDGQDSIARVIASDVRADVALLQLQQPPKDITPATIGDSDQVEVGDQIFVIGAPYGISQTLTAGHLSGRRRIDKEGETQKYIELLQTDAAVNGGNSGESHVRHERAGSWNRQHDHESVRRFRRLSLRYCFEYSQTIPAGPQAILVRHRRRAGNWRPGQGTERCLSRRGSWSSGSV